MANRQIEKLHPMLKEAIATIIFAVYLNTMRMIKTRLDIFTGSWDTYSKVTSRFSRQTTKENNMKSLSEYF